MTGNEATVSSLDQRLQTTMVRDSGRSGNETSLRASTSLVPRVWDETIIASTTLDLTRMSENERLGTRLSQEDGWAAVADAWQHHCMCCGSGEFSVMQAFLRAQ